MVAFCTTLILDAAVKKSDFLQVLVRSAERQDTTGQ
jgi:hypothetical protein